MLGDKFWLTVGVSVHPSAMGLRSGLCAGQPSSSTSNQENPVWDSDADISEEEKNPHHTVAAKLEVPSFLKYQGMLSYPPEWLWYLCSSRPLLSLTLFHNLLKTKSAMFQQMPQQLWNYAEAKSMRGLEEYSLFLFSYFVICPGRIGFGLLRTPKMFVFSPKY